MYRDWSIGPADVDNGLGQPVGFCHDGYDAMDPLDTRCGYAASIEAAKREIDLREAQDQDPDECPDCGAVDCNINH